MASRQTQAELDAIALAKKIGEDKLKENTGLENLEEELDAQDESDDGLMEDESILGIKKDGLPDYDEDTVAIEGDLNLDFQLLRQIPCPYTNVIAEFADVEIFAICVDSFLLELTAHRYHNWLLGGQTIILAKQIDNFLNALEELSAKFVLVWFSDLVPLFEQDAYLSFLHSFTIAYLSIHPKWSKSLECFANPLDELWNDYLHRLTPSFMLMSLENPSREFVNEGIDFSSRFISIAIHLITSAIPVVFFNGFTINFSNVMAYRLSTVPLSITNLRAKIAKIWEEHYELPKKVVCADVEKSQSVADFWATIIREEIQRDKKSDEDFESFCIAVLISALICQKLGASKRYPEECNSQKSLPPAVNHHRRRLCLAAAAKFRVVQPQCIKFSMGDLWDGRMVYGIYKRVASKIEVLPYRLQEEFARLHKAAALSVAVSTDVKDSLMDPATPVEERVNPVESLKMFQIDSELLNEFIPQLQQLTKTHPVEQQEASISEVFENTLKWRFAPIMDKMLNTEEPKVEQAPTEKPLKQEAWRIRRANMRLNRQRQTLSRWYQNFADSLEGRGNDLLVDFSRTPRLPQFSEVESESSVPLTPAKNGASAKEGGSVAKGKKGSKAAKEPQLSKKDQILKTNRDVMNKKQVESDKTKIAFATQVKANAISSLEEVFRKLELDESKAFCVYEKVIRFAEIFIDKLSTFETLEQKRNGALDLVEAIKGCLVKHMNFLEESQREKVRYLWVSLGFVKSTPKRRGDKRLDLEINLVDYQLYHGGRFIDILSDPKKDDRVTGFSPDGWQRKMLDVVDQYKSALIVAPTSAGKTFVSYYCIEKVLRKSNEDVVVYISPSKALMNQVVGSVYARFRNKPMVGGKVLYGTFSPEYSDNCMNCQVLVTVPECLEIMLLSPDQQVQNFVSRIKYVILDEVHCINASPQGHIWEHIFLLVRCPFLALSATISNVDVVKQWLQTAETNKALAGEQARQVEVITYDERWSELELAVHKIRECPRELTYSTDIELFVRGNSVQSNAPHRDTDSTELSNGGGESRAETPVPSEVGGDKSSTWDSLVQQFHPYGVYKPEKLKMFGIPADQRLTARQVVELYSVMSEIDEQVKKEFEPSVFFHYSVGSEEEPVWLTRKGLRDYETKLREKFVHWLEHDKEKTDQVFALMGRNVSDEFEKRSKPFNMRNSALHNIMPLMDDLKKCDRLPAICFSDDRDICQFLAIRVFIELQKREFNWRASPDFQRRYNFKAEDKAAKLAKRRRDEEEKERKKNKKKKTTVGEDGRKEGGRYEREDDFGDSGDHFAMQKLKMEEELKSFKLMGRWSDEDIYNNTIERLLGNRNRSRPSTLQLIRLFARGIGYHHDGMSAAERGAVEILFRAGFLGIVFSTSTLALGMNMPCKSVIFGIDTPMLTPLQFRQMSGRAGRRGFDPAGTVIFMALPTSKIRRLLTSSLATLRGNVPYTTSFMLKLFNYVKGDMGLEVGNALSGTPAKSVKKKQAVETTDVTNQAVRIRAALSLLKTPFALKTRQKNKLGVLDGLLKFLTLFNVQLLRKYQLLNEKCELTGFAHLANHLSSFQPGNLMFVAILQSGVLNRLLKKWVDDKPTFKDILVNIVAHIFTNKLLPIYAYDNSDDLTEAPVLKCMPKEVESVVNDYNSTVDKLLLSYLQLAVPSHQIENPVFALSGKTSETSVFSMDVVSVLDDGLAIDESLVPALSLDRKDHRGRRILRNSYAFDYWKRGDPRQLTESNKLMISEIWYLINDFNKVLEAIHEALAAIAKPTDKLLEIVGEICYEFDYKFKRGFGMKVREEEI